MAKKPGRKRDPNAPPYERPARDYVRLTFTPDEMRVIRTAANIEGLPVATWIKSLALKESTRVLRYEM